MSCANGAQAALVESKKKMVSGTYLRNAWYVAAWSDDLVEGQLVSRTLLKEPIVLYLKANGHVAPLKDRWHRQAPSCSSTLPATRVIARTRGDAGRCWKGCLERP